LTGGRESELGGRRPLLRDRVPAAAEPTGSPPFTTPEAVAIIDGSGVRISDRSLVIGD
jgi:hypothetical protein